MKYALSLKIICTINILVKYTAVECIVECFHSFLGLASVHGHMVIQQITFLLLSKGFGLKYTLHLNDFRAGLVHWQLRSTVSSCSLDNAVRSYRTY